MTADVLDNKHVVEMLPCFDSCVCFTAPLPWFYIDLHARSHSKLLAYTHRATGDTSTGFVSTQDLLSFIATLGLRPDFILSYSSSLADSRRHDDEPAASERSEVLNETVALSVTDFSGILSV